jgi:hypothetical protein
LWTFHFGITFQAQILEELKMSTQVVRRLKCVYALLLVVLVASQLRAAPPESGAKSPVFRIGAFDRSSAEFASGNPKEKVNFVVSKSNPTKDWFSVQPAALELTSKSQEVNIATTPRTITFSLERSPAEYYELHVALLVESASVPTLKVGINGNNGVFYLHPILDYSNGDQVDSFYPASSSADVEFGFPGSYLRIGANTITLQVIEEAEAAVPDAGVNYDAIELDSASRKADLQSVSAELVPTIFFQQRNGALAEAVDAFIRYSKPVKPGSSVDLTIGNKHYHSDVRSGHDFGEEKVQFQVSEFEPQAQARLVIKINGRETHYDQRIDPKKKWTIFIVPEIHVDVGYSDYQPKVAAIQSRAIDEAMDMTAQHPDFRFSLDGEWDLQQFLDTRSGAQQKRAIEAMQKKQLFVPAQYASLLTGIPSTETLIRSLYPSANIARKYGTPFDYANITDVPSYSWSYASILASAGIPYLAAASNNYRAPALLQGRLNENSPFWWVGPDNKRVLLWYSRIYQQMQMLFGLPPVLSAGRDTLPLFLQMYEHPNYHADAVLLYGTQVENTDLFPQQAELAGKWNSTYAYPRLQYAGFHEALETVQKQFGDNIPTVRGDGGPYWEDGAASDAHYLAIERWNEARGQTAEKLATLASLLNPVLKTNTAELSQMWTDMVLMDEHTWDSYNSVTDPTTMETVDQLAVKDQYAINAAARVDFVTRRSMANLVNGIPAGPGSLIVFNTLNWKRSGSVSIDLNKGNEIVDALTNEPVPHEVLSNGSERVGNRFRAEDVPPTGYKVYSMRQTQKVAPVSEPQQSASLESTYYKVQLDPATGAVRSIYDKQLQRELVDQNSPYRFGQYLYVTGGDKAPNTILQYSHVYPNAELEVHPSHDGKIVSVVRTPSGQVAHLESQNLNTPAIKTEIRLFDHEKKIEFVEDIDKNEVVTKEAAYFAFPFAAKQPQFQYEIQNGVVDPAKDMYPGAGHEWFTVQHWVSEQQDGVSGTVMPLDAPLVTLGDINRGQWPEKFGERPGTILSYVMNNYWDTNYRAGQGGHFSFHYVVTSAAATNPADLSRMGWEEITPLETDIVTTQDKAVSVAAEGQSNGGVQPSGNRPNLNSPVSLDGKQQHFLEVEDPNVLLETWKPAEDGNGTVMRFLDFGGTERTVTVRIPNLSLDHAWQTDAVERGQTALSIASDGQFQFTMHPHEIVTIRVVERNK